MFLGENQSRRQSDQEEKEEEEEGETEEDDNSLTRFFRRIIYFSSGSIQKVGGKENTSKSYQLIFIFIFKFFFFCAHSYTVELVDLQICFLENPRTKVLTKNGK